MLGEDVRYKSNKRPMKPRIFSIFTVYKCCILYLSEEDTNEKGKLYKPTSRFEKDSSAVSEQSQSFLDSIRIDRSAGKKKEKEKKKSNLEIFKEELKMYVWTLKPFSIFSFVLYTN